MLITKTNLLRLIIVTVFISSNIAFSDCSNVDKPMSGSFFAAVKQKKTSTVLTTMSKSKCDLNQLALGMYYQYCKNDKNSAKKHYNSALSLAPDPAMKMIYTKQMNKTPAQVIQFKNKNCPL